MDLIKRYSVGLRAGFAAGVVMDLVEYIVHFTFNLPDIRSVDWVTILIYGRVASNIYELALSQVMHLILTACWGLLYVYVGSYFNIKNPYWKGWNWAVFIWFISNTLIVLLKFPQQTEVRLASTLLYFLFASLYGIILGGITNRFDSSKYIKQR